MARRPRHRRQRERTQPSPRRASAREQRWIRATLDATDELQSALSKLRSPAGDLEVGRVGEELQAIRRRLVRAGSPSRRLARAQAQYVGAVDAYLAAVDAAIVFLAGEGPDLRESAAAIERGNLGIRRAREHVDAVVAGHDTVA